MPASALADVLLAHWQGKQPLARIEPDELRRVLDDVRRLYALTRASGISWEFVKNALLHALRAVSKIGKRDRPIATTAADTPPGPTSVTR